MTTTKTQATTKTGSIPRDDTDGYGVDTEGGGVGGGRDSGGGGERGGGGGAAEAIERDSGAGGDADGGDDGRVGG